ncbi:prephenate dehydrogenase/arogenate dehydrogenase family protein [Nocardioides sp. C4-1]|uniref:prephenate dehydrogenase n=1 Tax=Nocardioides sp. C4-1 TaxID=3151851 RepID=UPI003266F8C5
MTFSRVAVVGAGLIGGSVVRRLAALGVETAVVDPGVSPTRSVPVEADLVVVAVPLDAMPSVLADVAVQAPDAVVVDVGSVKGTVAEAASSAGLDGRYVGAHPMAGTEHSGFEHSSADLLVGATWAVTRGPGPVAPVVAWLTEVFEASVVVLDADAHDRAVAHVSHLPHVLANALLELAEGAGDRAAALLAAGSFRDGTRVAGRDALRTRNMLTDNAAALAPMLDDAIELLLAYRHELTEPDRLAEHLGRVADGAAVVRQPELRWTPCPDLDAALVGTGPVVVRRTGDGLETAPA